MSLMESHGLEGRTKDSTEVVFLYSKIDIAELMFEATFI